MSFDWSKATYKEAIQVAKWENGRTPEDGPPDSIQTISTWRENGEVVSDPQRIEELDARAEAQAHASH